MVADEGGHHRAAEHRELVAPEGIGGLPRPIHLGIVRDLPQLAGNLIGQRVASATKTRATSSGRRSDLGRAAYDGLCLCIGLALIQ